MVLSTDQLAVEEFQALSHGSPGRDFPYPNPVGDSYLRDFRPKGRKSLPLLLYVGSFERREAVDLIVGSCESLWQSGHPFRMRYVGSGPLRSLIEEHLRRSGGGAELYPFAEVSVLLKRYEEADTLLLPSRRDGWGLPVHEGLWRQEAFR
jgi:glycosyltransferase involved in cell wall biosynthesis